MTRYKLLFIVIFIQIFSVSVFCQTKAEESKFFSKNIVSKLEDPKTNVNLLWSDYLVTIQNYDLWSDINYSNYEGIDRPFVTGWIDNNERVVVIDDTLFYFVINTDTIFFGQEVFTDNIEGQTIRISPLENKKNIQFKVAVAVDEYIKQFLSPTEYGRDNMEDKEALLETWEKVSPYQPVQDSAQYYFKIPFADSISDIEHIKTDLDLGNTTLYYEAEGGGHDLNYIYKGKPAEHRITGMIVRIEKYDRDKLIETKYIQVSFPEAC